MLFQLAQCALRQPFLSGRDSARQNARSKRWSRDVRQSPTFVSAELKLFENDFDGRLAYGGADLTRKPKIVAVCMINRGDAYWLYQATELCNEAKDIYRHR